MDPTRDNPFIRFATFWWALGTFLVFALLLAVIALINRKPAESLEEVAAQARYTTKENVAKAQAAALDPAKIDAAIATVAQKLVATKPAAVEKPDHVVPGTPTAAKIAAAPPVDTSAVDKPAADPNAPIDPAVMELGKAQYIVCSGCHGQNGEGGPLGPPLAGSEWVTGPVSNPIRIQFRGLQGPIHVAGKEFSTFPAPMTAIGAGNTDENIAAVLTFVRNSFGNKASAVTADQVKALRGEIGKPPLTEQDLTKP